DDLIDEWIIKRPDHHAHGRGEQTVRISAQLPVAQVRSGEKNSSSLRNGSLEVLESLVADPVADLSFSDLWKSREGHEQTANRGIDAIHGFSPPLVVPVRVRETEIGVSHAAEAWQHPVEPPSVRGSEPFCNSNRCRLERPEDCARKRRLDAISQRRSMPQSIRSSRQLPRGRPNKTPR